jgi:hypothetical protein
MDMARCSIHAPLSPGLYPLISARLRASTMPASSASETASVRRPRCRVSAPKPPKLQSGEWGKNAERRILQGSHSHQHKGQQTQ